MEEQQYIDLCGEWKCKLDENDVGEKEAWYQNVDWQEEKSIVLPGSIANNQLGMKEEMKISWDRQTLNGLRARYTYEGSTWYQKEVYIKEDKEKQKIYLTLERVMMQSKIWINEKLVGEFTSLSVPHRYDVTDFMKSNTTNQIVIKIDNRDYHHLGRFSSAYTNETQTIWNGMIGKIRLDFVNWMYVTALHSELDTHYKDIILNANLYVSKEKATEIEKRQGNFFVLLKQKDETISFQEGEGLSCEILKLSHNEDTSDNDQNDYILFHFRLKMSAKNLILWDEFTPSMYEIFLYYEKIKIYQVKTGFRKIETQDRKIKMNGKKRFFRGTLNCCLYPKTGYPPMDKDSWIKEFKIIKEYGLNHVRFHSNCPPNAAFEAADELGIYLQIEGPIWLDDWMELPFGKYNTHYEFVDMELPRLLREYEIHPSFCIFSNGNELNGDLSYLQKMMLDFKKHNSNILYTTSSNWDRKEHEVDDVVICEKVDEIGIRGQYCLNRLTSDTTFTYDTTLKRRKAPILSHEIGQYAVYPDVDEIPKYDGVLYPLNLCAMKKNMEEKGVYHLRNEYVKASVIRAELLYKLEAEATYRSEEMAGFQLLGLNDFMGQASACTGILNTFYEAKPGIDSAQVSSFFNSDVMLVTLERFIYDKEEHIPFVLKLFHYSNQDFVGKTATVYLKDKDGTLLHQKEYPLCHMTEGVCEIARDSFWIGNENAKERIELEIGAYVMDQGLKKLLVPKNTWDLWAYSTKRDDVANFTEEGFYECDKLDEKAKKILATGGRVFLRKNCKDNQNFRKGNFHPVFWSPVYFESNDSCGTIIDTKHPLFDSYFHTKEYATLEWKEILERAYAYPLPINSPLNTLVEFVPNFAKNERSMVAFEAKVGTGSIFVFFIDFKKEQEENASVRALYHACQNYFISKQFLPTQQISIHQLEEML